MRELTERQVLLVIDRDEKEGRFEMAMSYTPEDLRDRVFVLSSSKEPEKLTAELKLTKEKVGAALAEDCDHGTNEYWGHEMLAHNTSELERLRMKVRPFLFGS